MNNHKTACIVLVIAIVGMLYGVNQLRTSSVKAREAADSVQAQAETAESQAQLAQIQLKQLDGKTADLRKISGEWREHFNSFQTAQDAEQRIVSVVQEGDVFLISQKFEERQIENASFIKTALVADLVVEDEFAKTLNWLGQIEEKVPSCRISRCNITRGDRGNDVHLELQIQIPVLGES